MDSGSKQKKGGFLFGLSAAVSRANTGVKKKFREP